MIPVMTRMRATSSKRLMQAGLLGLAMATIIPSVRGEARQGTSAATGQMDPRVGLKPGVRDAGVAARNLELVASVPKPEGFFDPKMPAGEPIPPEPPSDSATPAPAPPAAPPAPTAPSPADGLRFVNSDMAFTKDRLLVGNFNGFNAYDISDPKSPKLIVSVVCPGGQGDVSVYGNLLFMSVEETRPRRLRNGRGHPAGQPRAVPGRADLRHQRPAQADADCRGADLPRIAHAHAGHGEERPRQRVHLRIGYRGVRSGDELAGCSGLAPKDDPKTALFSIDVIQVPLAAPAQANLVNQPRIFADPATGNIAGLWQGGNYGPGTQTSSETNRCHDITVFPELGLAAGACSGNGILLDISDPVHPTRVDQVSDKNFAFWHSATFNNDGTKVLFTDEWGGGVRPRCRATDLPTWGADAIFEIADRKMHFAGYFKMPAAQTETENCVAHNGSLIPVPGRDIMVQGWYQGGVSVFDFTEAAHPVEIAFFDRGPLDVKNLIIGGVWSAYWYNGRIYASEMARGLDVFRLTPARSPDAERNRRRQPGPRGRGESPAADEGYLAGDAGYRARVSRSADAQQGVARRARCGRAVGADARRQGQVWQGRDGREGAGDSGRAAAAGHAERSGRQARRRTRVNAHGDRRGAAVSGSRVADGAAVKRWQPSAHAPRVCASETAPQAGKTRLRLSVR